MTFFLLSLVIGGTVSGDLLKTAAMRHHGEIVSFGPRALVGQAAAVARIPLFWLCIAGYAVSFFGFVALLSIADVSFAVPATAAAYVVETLLAKTLLNETVSGRRWAGTVLVTCGVVMISW